MGGCVCVCGWVGGCLFLSLSFLGLDPPLFGQGVVQVVRFLASFTVDDSMATKDSSLTMLVEPDVNRFWQLLSCATNMKGKGQPPERISGPLIL